LSETISYEKAIDYSDFNPWAMNSSELVSFIESIPARKKAVEDHWAAVRKNAELIGAAFTLRRQIEAIDEIFQTAADLCCDHIRVEGFPSGARREWDKIVKLIEEKKEPFIHSLKANLEVQRQLRSQNDL
jgi:hypothetical protein